MIGSDGREWVTAQEYTDHEPWQCPDCECCVVRPHIGHEWDSRCACAQRNYLPEEPDDHSGPSYGEQSTEDDYILY